MATAGGYCADCFKPGTPLGDEAPAGTVETVHGLPTYVARPPAASSTKPVGLVVIISDVFGWCPTRTRLLADSYARKIPAVVYLPDFMDGNAPSGSLVSLFDRVEKPSPNWFTRYFLKPLWFVSLVAHVVPLLFRIRASVARPRIGAFFSAIRGSRPPVEFRASSSSSSSGSPPLKVGAVGFCWGGRYCIELCGGLPDKKNKDGGERTPLLVDCGFAAHPSGMEIPRDVLAVRAPLSVASGDEDRFLGREALETVRRVLVDEGGEDDNAGGTRHRHEVVVYPGAKHGFAVRADPAEPRQVEMGLQAKDQAVAWFRRQFGPAGASAQGETAR